LETATPPSGIPIAAFEPVDEVEDHAVEVAVFSGLECEIMSPVSSTAIDVYCAGPESLRLDPSVHKEALYRVLLGIKSTGSALTIVTAWIGWAQEINRIEMPIKHAPLRASMIAQVVDSPSIRWYVEC